MFLSSSWVRIHKKDHFWVQPETIRTTLSPLVSSSFFFFFFDASSTVSQFDGVKEEEGEGAGGYCSNDNDDNRKNDKIK